MAEKEDKLTRLRNKLSEKETSLDNCNKKIENARVEIKTLKSEIQKLNKEIGAAELENLGDILRKNGVSLGDILSAVERGEFKKAESSADNEIAEKSDEDKSENLNISQHFPEKVEENENCATYSTEIKEVKPDGQ